MNPKRLFYIFIALAAIVLIGSAYWQTVTKRDESQDQTENNSDNDHNTDGTEEDSHDQTDADSEDSVSGIAANDNHGSDEATPDNGHDEATSDDGHDEAETEDGHGSEPGIGYLGLESQQPIDDTELDAFRERVIEEAYIKAKLDQARLIFFALCFVIVLITFAKIKKLEPYTKRIREAFDWHTLGTVTGLILIGLVIPSGIIVTFFYMPTPEGAYASVEYMTTQPVLAFFRNLHNWSSEIFIFLMILHAARTISTHTFMGKRKFIWLAGAMVGVIGWVAFLSGSFMRGDQEALEGFEHMMYSFTLVPLGKYVSQFFSGELTLMKLTALHIGATVFLMGIFLGLHVLLRKVHVLITQRWKKATLYMIALTLFLVAQSILMEAPFIRGTASGPTVSGIEITKPPWPIYFLIQGENWFGANAMVAILAVVFIPLIVFPYALNLLPVSRAKKIKIGKIAFYTGTFALILISFIAAAGEIQAHIF